MKHIIISAELNQYLKKELAEGKIDFEIRVTLNDRSDPEFYIHPIGKDGATADFVIVLDDE